MEHEAGGDTNQCTRNGSQRFSKELEELEIEGRAEIIQSTALLRLNWEHRRVMGTGGDLLSLR